MERCGCLHTGASSAQLSGWICCTPTIIEPLCDFLCFPGTKYWVYHGQYPVSGYPKPVSELGLPNAIDAAVPIGGKKTFFFKKKMVWRYDERLRRVDKSFPKPIKAVWKDLPHRIRIGFTHDDGEWTTKISFSSLLISIYKVWQILILATFCKNHTV